MFPEGQDSVSSVTRILGILSLILLPALAVSQEQPSEVRANSINHLLEKAQGSLEHGDLAGAEAQLEQALSLERSGKNAGELNKRLAMVEYLLGKFDQFDLHIREAIRLDPLDA